MARTRHEKVYEGSRYLRIKVLVADNLNVLARKPYNRFNLYVDGMTVAKYYSACEAAGHVYRNYSLDI
jgi:hypothetical protein